MSGAYDAIYERSLKDPEGFWGEAAAAIRWTKPYDRVLDDTRAPLYRWFPGGELNTCYECLDRHVEAGHGEQPALVYDSPVTGKLETFTFAELTDRVARFAGALRKLGVEKGDRVLVYMPMVPEAVVAMLASARLGAVHSVVFGGFAANELAKRIDDAAPKVIVSASCGIEPKRVVAYKPMLDQAIELSRAKPEHCVLLQRAQVQAELIEGRDVEWGAAIEGVEPAECVPVAATDPLYILYTSGTTGQPKGVVRDNGGHAVALKWTMKAVYGVEPGEVYWAASDVGWVVGHSYIVYAPLMNRNTTVLFEGKPVGTPDAGAFWRVIEQHQVKTLFTAPTAFRAIRQQDPDAQLLGKYDLSHFRALFLAGERCDPDTLEWAGTTLGVPVIDHWWQTETGWPIASNCLGIEVMPIKAGSPTKAVPGWDVQVLDDAGQPVPAGTIGNIVVKLPLPPGTLPTLWNAEERFKEAYLSTYPGYYQTSDAGLVDEEGYVFVMARTDDVINVAGHRLSTGGMEEVLSAHPAVAEAAVIGVPDEFKGQVPVGFIVLSARPDVDEAAVAAEAVKMVRERIGAVASLRKVVVVKRLPKTRSGKILRRTMRSLADGQTVVTPPTIEDPSVLPEIEAALSKAGLTG